MGGRDHAATRLEPIRTRNIASEEARIIYSSIVRRRKRLHRGCGGRGKERSGCSDYEQGLLT